MGPIEKRRRGNRAAAARFKAGALIFLAAFLAGVFPGCAAHHRGAGPAGETPAPRVRLDSISEADLFGRFYLGAPGGDGCEGYYSTLDALRPLLESEDWLRSVTGFYINAAQGCNGVRLSYFTDTPEDAVATVERYAESRGLKEVWDREDPAKATLSDRYGGMELRFRRFLAAYTQIGLDVIKRDLLYAKRVFVTYRWQVSIAREPIVPHFENLFEMSPFFNSLSNAQKEELMEGMALWPEGSEVDWAHMFVNMVLCGDWIRDAWRERYEEREPLSTRELNRLLESCGRDLRIPGGWRP